MPSLSPPDIDKTEVETVESIHKPPPTTCGKDKAAELLASSERIVVIAAENERVLRRFDLIILPILLSVYCPQSLNKTALSYASVFGLIEDADLDPNSDQYSWLGSIVYIARLVMQPLVAFFLVKFPIGKLVVIMLVEAKETAEYSLVGHGLTSFYPGISPPVYSSSGQNTRGDTKSKIGPHLFEPSENSHYYRGLRSNLALFVAIVVLIVLAVVYIIILNRKHSMTRESMEKVPNVVYLSMERSRSRDAEGVEDVQTSGVGDKAFNDVTDIKNEDFVYVY
ncbi:transmembrane transport [Ascochyta rabiei]|uniref:Transmembrane transport n=1 Tax=Didymella rabiei TaxID=5454 RepID=A0A162WDH6_DIDRA|nr:transmembrane transport [Ascochyta rabiei]